MNIAILEIPSEWTAYDASFNGKPWRFECEHLNTETETEIIDYMTFSGPEQHEYTVHVCTECGEIIETPGLDEV